MHLNLDIQLVVFFDSVCIMLLFFMITKQKYFLQKRY